MQSQASTEAAARHHMWLTHVQLSPSVSMPTVGFGTFRLRGDAAVAAVTAALQAGTRHIDTASIYKNYNEIRRAIAASGVPRSEVFITSKVSPYEHGRKKASAAVDACLAALGMLLASACLIWSLTWSCVHIHIFTEHAGACNDNGTITWHSRRLH